MPATVKILWSKAEDEHLVKLRELGYSNQQIGDAIGRPRSIVGHRLIFLLGSRERGSYVTRKIMGKAPPLPEAAANSSTRAEWTEEIDERILSLRMDGLSYSSIADAVGRGHTATRNRILLLTDGEERPVIERPVIEKAPSVKKQPPIRIARFVRPAGPVPDHPEAPASPYEPGWRKCLGDGCKRYFWSPSASVRICPNCKNLRTRVDGHGANSRISDTSEYALHL